MIDDVYRGYANEHEELERVRASFQCFTPAPLPDGVRLDEPNRCSVTALLVSYRENLTPVRGYALMKRKRTRKNLHARPAWIGHWWAVTEAGRVVDASWREPGLAYVGERLAVRREQGPELTGYTLDGAPIRDLGVYVYPPQIVEAELERMLAEFGRSA